MTRTLSESDLIAFRRDLHRNPELSHQESRTAGRIAQALQDLGYEVQTGIAGHGVVAELVGPHPGPTLLYRADIDALPIHETSEHEYASQNKGVMHACGHDVHATVGIGVAAAMMACRDQVHGRIRFVFQPAEEAAPPPGQSIGAEKMVQEGVLNDPPVDAAFALHVMPLLEVGKIGFTGGPVWAASELFDIHIEGKMAHGAYPHEGIDPIACGAQIVQALQTVVSRNVDARDACVLSVCRFDSGSAYNIVPQTAHLQGLLRTLKPEVRELALERMKTVVEKTAEANGCTATLQTVRGTYLTANDPVLESFVVDSVEQGESGLTPTPFLPQMGAEDFAAFSRRVPGAYLFLGVRNEERGIVHMIHTPRFDVDERCIAMGVHAMRDALLAAGARWSELADKVSVPPV